MWNLMDMLFLGGFLVGFIYKIAKFWSVADESAPWLVDCGGNQTTAELAAHQHLVTDLPVFLRELGPSSWVAPPREKYRVFSGRKQRAVGLF